MEEKSTSKMFSPSQVGISGLLGGPLGGGYVIATNFKKQGREMAYIVTVLGAIAITFFTFIILFGLPEKYYLRLPKIVLMPLFAVPAFAIGSRMQGKAYDNHLAKGGAAESWVKVLVVGLLGFLFMFVGIRTFSDSTPPMQGEAIGGALGKSRFLYYANMPEQDATAIFSKMEQWGFFEAKQGQPRVQLTRKDNNTFIKVPIEQKRWEAKGIVNFYNSLADSLTANFPAMNPKIVLYSQTPVGRKEKVWDR